MIRPLLAVATQENILRGTSIVIIKIMIHTQLDQPAAMTGLVVLSIEGTLQIEHSRKYKTITTMVTTVD